MKKLALIIFVVFITFKAPSNIQAATFTVNNPSETTFFGKWQGFGAEWDPFFWNAYNQSQGLTQSDWDLIISRISEMKMPMTRMWMQVYFAKVKSTGYTYSSQWDFNQPRMQSLYKYLDYACAHDVQVFLTDWGWTMWPSYGLYPGPPPISTQYTADIATYLNELIVNRGYTCIKGLIVGNEPDYEVVGVNGITIAQYAQMIKNMDQALKNIGLRNKIKLIAPDPACCQSLFFGALQDQGLWNYLDAYDFHLYTAQSSINSIAGYIWGEIDSRRDWLTDQMFNGNSTAYGKPLYVTEAGMSDVSANNSWSYALDMADYGTSALLSRVQGVIAWNMFDIYYDMEHQNDQANVMNPWGMWKYKDANWALKPWAQTWGLLVRFAPRDSIQSVVNTTPPQQPTDSVRVGAVKRPDGGWSIFLVNRTASTTAVQLNLPDNTAHTFSKYFVDSTTLASYPNNIIVPALQTQTITSNATLNLPAQSFTVLAEQVTPTKITILNYRAAISVLINLFNINNLIANFGK